MQILILLHILATVVWVGGMFFAHQCLRPVALAQLEPPQRLRLWTGVFGRFFPWVWLSVILLIGTGQALVAIMGGMAAVAYPIHVMVLLGYLMSAIFMYLYFAPYGRLREAVAAQDWPAAGAALNRIRVLVGTNLLMGIANIALVFLLPMTL